MIDTQQSSEIRIPNPHLGERENHNIIQSEIEGGVYLWDLPIDGQLEIQTQNRAYVLVKEHDGNVLLSGHPEFCPSPTVPVQPELESERSPLVSIPPFGRGFSRHRGLPIRWSLEGTLSGAPASRSHRLDEPTRLSLGRVASQQSPLLFHLAQSL